MKGAGFALISAALFGASTPLAKMIVGDVRPLMVAGLFYLGAGVGLAAYRLFASRAAIEAKLSRADMPWLVGAIVFGGMLAPALLMIGLAETSAGTASLLLTLEGVATALIALIIFREHVGWRNAGGFALIVAGSAMLAWRGDVATPTLLGPVLIVCACVAWGIDNNLTRQVASTDPLAITMWKGLIAGPVNIVLALAAGEGAPALSSALVVMVLGLAGIGASLVLFILAMRELGTARTGAYFGTAPFVGAVIAVPLFHEPVGGSLILAGLLIGGGVVIHLTENHAHDHLHEPMAHEHAHVHDAHHQHEHAGTDPPDEPHAHRHIHARLVHSHAHTPDEHHRHTHEGPAA